MAEGDSAAVWVNLGWIDVEELCTREALDEWS